MPELPPTDPARSAPVTDVEQCLWELSIDMLALADLRGRLTRVSASWADVLGYTAQELTARPFLEFVHPDDVARTAEAAQALTVPGGAVTAFEHRCVAKGGEHVRLAWSARTSEDGRSVCCVVRDVSVQRVVDVERERSQDELRRRDRMLTDVVENSMSLIYVKDLDGRYLLYNQAFAEAFSLEARGRAEGRRGMEVLLGRDDVWLEPVLQPIWRENDLRAARESHFIEEWSDHPERGRLNFDSMKFPMRDADGAVYATCGVSLDVTERVRAIERHQQAEDRFKGAFEYAPIGMALIDRDFRIMRANDALCRIVGWGAGELLGVSLAELALEGDEVGLHRERLDALGRNVIDQYHQELQLKGENGRAVWVLVSWSAVRGEDGRALHFIAHVKDVSADNRAGRLAGAQAGVARALAECEHLDEASEEILAALGEPLGWACGTFWTLDRDAQELTCTAQWRREGFDPGAFGKETRERRLARGEGIPGRVWELDEVVWIPEIRDCHFFTRTASATAAGLRAAVAIPIRDRDGVCGVVEFFDRRLTAPDADLLEVLTTASEQVGQYVFRKTAELHVRLSEARLQTILEHTPAVVSLKDADGRHVLVNRAFEQMLGVPAEVVVGRTPEELFPAELAAAVRKVDEIVTGSGRSLEIEEEAVMADGKTHTFLSLKFPLPDAEGRSVGVCSVSTDITERKHAEATLQAAHAQAVETSRLKSEFVANMSHELRTPLNGVIGMTDLLLSTSLDNEQTEYAEMAQRAGEALLSVISDVLDFSKIEAGKLELDEHGFDLRQVVDDSCAMAAEGAFSTGIELLVCVEPTLPHGFHGDSARLRQVLTNLVSNAVKFTEAGEVVVRVFAEADDHVQFAVSDTGIGIDETRKAQLWEAFTQADSSTTRLYGGTGLGLTISRQLVERMGGAISVDSELGRGSTFSFSIPLAVSESSVGPHGAELAGRAVLAVDDNATNRSILRRQLAALGAAVTIVSDGAQALEALREAATAGRPFDLAMLDFNMPHMDGVALARRIREEPWGFDTRLVMLTSSGSERVAAREAGVGTYLTKPVRYDRLSRALSDALATSPHIADATASVAARGGGATTVRLLVVEDNQVNQLVARAMLERMGYRVDVALDGLEAVEMWAANDYNAVLMDVQMPRLDGYGATERIRATEAGTGRVPVIAMTANAMAGDRERCLDAGMDDYLTKPIKSDELREALDRWVGASAARSISAPLLSGASSESGGSPALLQESVLNDLEGLGGVVLDDLLSLYFSEADRQLGELTDAVRRGEQVAVARTAHKLKGGSSVIGAAYVSKVAAQLEAVAKADDLQSAPDLLERLRSGLAATQAAFRDRAT